jgi:hypothetical protein
MTQRTAAGILVVLIVGVIAVVAVYLTGPQTPLASPSPTPSATQTVAAATATPSRTPSVTGVTPPPAATPAPSVALCDAYQAGDVPIVPPRLSGRWLRVALDAVRPATSGHNRWAIRFMLASDAPASAEIPLSVSVTGRSGPLQIFRYSAGPPNSEDVTITQPITLTPCGRGAGIIVMVAETSGVTSGTYTIVAKDIRRPEGDRVDETWTVALTCTTDPGPAGGLNCR